MTRSMQPTIDRIAQAAANTERLAASYRRGYEDGTAHGKQAAYRSLSYWLTIAAACGAILWML